MCGIIGYIGKANAVDIILSGLKKLEYRGYDSAGIAVIVDRKVHIRRSVGKLCNLYLNFRERPISANIGIGHTRWATHGKPSEENAHPHTDYTKSIVIVHNGIIENYAKLRDELQNNGHEFKSETDTEVVAHLIKEHYKNNLLYAVQKTLIKIEGSYAFGIICKEEPDKIICARQDAPLIIGVGKDENFIASDVAALLPHTRDMIFLENGDIAEVTVDKIIVKDVKNNMRSVKIKSVECDAVQSEKSGYKHFMLKEIFEQPSTIENTLNGRIYPNEGRVFIEEVKIKEEYIKKDISNICVVACGTAYYAGLVSKILFEEFAKIPTEVDIASEFRYREPILNEKTLVIVISQSGETADTLAALRLAKNKGCQTLAICNVIESSISRESVHVIYTCCGPEIGVASTKTFTGQLTALYILALDWAFKRGKLTKESLKIYLKELEGIPLKIRLFLEDVKPIKIVAKMLAHKKIFLYLGRYLNYPIALEGALKLKEISYIHAEGYAAGEMKHGPIALIDASVPVVVVAVAGRVYKKIISNIEEARARGGVIIAVASDSNEEIKNKSDYVIYVPKTSEFISPIMTIIPLQLLAYYISVFLGCDVDQPRNLAKSVTVE
ncbi:MAG: glutamine--fructose-6-phosphate transaminase (isomerizing) [Endomicrobium sp.]|jgi:glucosamine--fructose-6-phosphate aminotransferase (isomerizing)|nr:glutamine--fructose-6-phosphate transaminase (isomerizing) [Endomicrobium sp.]